MNFFSWEFSKEALPELNKFLQVVDQNDECKLDKKFLEIFPELKDMQNNLENSTYLEDITITNNDVILVEDDDDKNMEILQEIKTELPDISLLNLTQATSASNVDVLNTDVDVFVEYLLECLENENLILEKEHVTKLVNEYNNNTLNYLFYKLCEISENGLYNLNKSICKHADEPLKSIPGLFCKIILFPKLQNTNPTKKILSVMKEFCETFPEVTRQELIVLFLLPDSDNDQSFQTVINMISDVEKQYLLRDFVYMASELVVWQLPILESLLSFTIEDKVKRRLLNLMEISADKFKTEKLFIKFLIAIINRLDSGFEDQEQIIYSIIEKSKTTNKISAQKALKKWADKHNVL